MNKGALKAKVGLKLDCTTSYTESGGGFVSEDIFYYPTIVAVLGGFVNKNLEKR